MLTPCLILTLLALAHAFPSDNRIVNGTDAEPGEFPYVVSLRLGRGHMCGGSIINEYWILTAAHCVADWSASFLTVQYGVVNISSNYYNTAEVEEVFFHSLYEEEVPLRNDVALLKLKEPLEFNEYVQPITLPPAYNATPGDAPAVLVGWGFPYSGGGIMTTLQRVDLKVFTDSDCERLHALTGPTNYRYHVCGGVVGGGKGQCSGDSGGPLTVNGVQVGIVSWSVKPCTIAPYPGVFTKVSSYIDWINQRIAENKNLESEASVTI